MADYHRMPAPLLQLYRLTLLLKGNQLNAYSMGESVDDAFKRYIERVISLKENVADVEFVQGDLANPHGQLRS